jgi:isopentenyldiphosphate isomerase
MTSQAPSKPLEPTGAPFGNEPFEIFDATGDLLGVASRSRVHREGLCHRASSVFLFRPDGRLIIQRRQWTKDVCPGAWDLSVAEHLTPGETYEQAAERGLREELEVHGVELEPVGEVMRAKLEIPEKAIKDYELQRAFRGVFGGEVRVNAGEVCEIDAITLVDLAVACQRRPNDFTPWFRRSAATLGIFRAKARSFDPPTAERERGSNA